MARNAIDRLVAAIGYPDRVAEGSSLAMLRVDGFEVSASVAGGRLVLSQRLTAGTDRLPELAGYAAGRMLREEAVLAFGDGAAFVWQDASSESDDRALVRLFESFMDSCDWWRARVERRQEEASPQLSDMVILP